MSDRKLLKQANKPKQINDKEDINNTPLTIDRSLEIVAQGATLEEILLKYGLTDKIQDSLDRVEDKNAISLLKREGHQDVAMLQADELANILETLHLLRSPTNAKILFTALEESIVRDNIDPKLLPNHSIEELRQELKNERESENHF